jgi:hypothetical protein
MLFGESNSSVKVVDLVCGVLCYVGTLGHVLIAIRHHIKPQNVEVGI